MPTVDDILGRYKPAEKTVRINLDGQLAARIDELREEHKFAVEREKAEGESLDSKAGQLAREVVELRKTQRDEATAFMFRGMPGDDLDELIREHPPTESQWAEYREMVKSAPWIAPPEFDVDAMRPLMIARSLVAIDEEPVDWTPEDVQRMWGKLHDGARADLYDATKEVNQRRNARPTYGTGTDETPSSGPGSTTPPNGESPSQSSTEES